MLYAQSFCRLFLCLAEVEVFEPEEYTDSKEPDTTGHSVDGGYTNIIDLDVRLRRGRRSPVRRGEAGGFHGLEALGH